MVVVEEVTVMGITGCVIGEMGVGIGAIGVEIVAMGSGSERSERREIGVDRAMRDRRDRGSSGSERWRDRSRDVAMGVVPESRV